MKTTHPALTWGALVVGVSLMRSRWCIGSSRRGRCPFFPGHEAGSGHHHVKHGIAAFLVGVACSSSRGSDRSERSSVCRPRDPPSVIIYWQAIVLGLLQGVSELFPISSLGHSVILPKLLGWDIHQNDDYFITFLVATHLATAIVLSSSSGATGCGSCGARQHCVTADRSDDTDAKLGRLLVVGTIPAGLLGSPRAFAANVFASARSASFFLASTGCCSSAPSYYAGARRGSDPTRQSRCQTGYFGHAFKFGAAQAIALIPGFSRSGTTMGGGLLAGLAHEDTARFAFLLATPIIGAAALQVCLN